MEPNMTPSSTTGPKIRKIIYTLFFLLMTVLILTNSQKSTYYALNGLNLWFTKMIPSLLPFMILSGIMVRLQLTEGFVSIIHPLLYPVWRVRKNVTYAMIMGFFCGFPMGARVTCDLLERDMITEKEAGFLLAFCNNIGPVYFTSFVLPLLRRRLVLPYLLGMYGVPFVYGLLLRHTAYRDITSDLSKIQNKKHAMLSCNTQSKELTAASSQATKSSYSLLEQIDEAITSSIQGIMSLGGYMILFNLFNLVPAFITDFLLQVAEERSFTPVHQLFVEALPSLTAPILEITGGLGMLGTGMPLYSLLLLPFGGLSCIAQTYSIIRRSDLSIHTYVYHKLILTGITALYYAGWQFFFPGSFLA